MPIFGGGLPLWQKILGGIALTLPSLILAILTHVGIFLTLFATSLVAYTGSGLILEDHYLNHVNSLNQLATSFSALATLLETTITALDMIRLGMTEENAKFAANNDQLTTQLQKLQTQITEMATINGKITQAYEQNQQVLKDKIDEFNKVKTGLESEIEKAQMAVKILQVTVTEFSSKLVADKVQQDNFQQRLNDFLQNKEGGFNTLISSLGETEKKLAKTEENLRQCQQHYEAQIRELQRQIDRLTGLNDQASASSSINDKLNFVGVFGVQNPANSTKQKIEEVILQNPITPPTT